MDREFAERMGALTNAFYRERAASFSATRQGPWQGWTTLLGLVVADGASELAVLDVACGNLRFERFLEGVASDVRAFCVDDCDELVRLGEALGVTVTYVHADVASALLDDALEREAPVERDLDLAVCFGYMHHLPLRVQRLRLLRYLCAHVRVGGHVACTFWQFGHDERIMSGALRPAGGGPADYLLGWQGDASVPRFCHDTDEREIDGLVQALGPQVSEVARFSADGRSGDLNRYLVLRLT